MEPSYQSFNRREKYHLVMCPLNPFHDAMLRDKDDGSKCQKVFVATKGLSFGPPSNLITVGVVFSRDI